MVTFRRSFEIVAKLYSWVLVHFLRRVHRCKEWNEENPVKYETDKPVIKDIEEIDSGLYSQEG